MNLLKSETLTEAIEGKIIYVLALVILIQTIYPITVSEAPIYLLGYQFLYMLLIIAGIFVARESPGYTVALIVAGIVWLVVGIIYTFNQDYIWALIMGFVVIFIFQAMVIRVLVEYIFLKQTVTRDVLYAAVAVYLLFGALFVPIYGLIDIFTILQTGQSAFVDGGMPVAEGVPMAWQTFIYYSYASLTTLGYGDILPVTLWARSAASVEAIIGVLYTVIIMGRLVGVYISNQETAPIEQISIKKE